MKVGIKSYAYCLNHAPETGSHYGGTPYEAFHSGKEQEYLAELPKHLQTYGQVLHYAPNQTYIGGISYEEFESLTAGWVNNPLPDEKSKGCISITATNLWAVSEADTQQTNV